MQPLCDASASLTVLSAVSNNGASSHPTPPGEQALSTLLVRAAGRTSSAPAARCSIACTRFGPIVATCSSHLQAHNRCRYSGWRSYPRNSDNNAPAPRTPRGLSLSSGRGDEQVPVAIRVCFQIPHRTGPQEEIRPSLEACFQHSLHQGDFVLGG